MTIDATRPRIDVLRPSDGRWTAFLAQTDHDVYHLPAYVESEARREGGEACALLASLEGVEVFLPLVMRHLALDGTSTRIVDAVSPYGYCSPIVAWDARPDRAVVRKVLGAAVAALADVGACCAFVRLHPLLPLPEEAMRSWGMVVTHGETVYVDLAASNEEIWHQTRLSDRNNISWLRRNGYGARVDDTWGRFADFKGIYRDTMARVGASSDYYFDGAYFDALRSGLGDRLHLIVVEAGSETAAAGLFTEENGIVQFHLSGTAEAHRQHGPSRLMLDFARGWAKVRGNRWFHLGGGVGGRPDSLFRFKCGFSKLRAPFSTWRVVASRTVYEGAVKIWESRHGLTADADDGFFPAYRKPVSTT